MELVAELISILDGGTVANTWPISTVTRMCDYIDNSKLKKDDCSDTDATGLENAAKMYQAGFIFVQLCSEITRPIRFLPAAKRQGQVEL